MQKKKLAEIILSLMSNHAYQVSHTFSFFLFVFLHVMLPGFFLKLITHKDQQPHKEKPSKDRSRCFTVGEIVCDAKLPTDRDLM